MNNESSNKHENTIHVYLETTVLPIFKSLFYSTLRGLIAEGSLSFPVVVLILIVQTSLVTSCCICYQDKV